MREFGSRAEKLPIKDAMEALGNYIVQHTGAELSYEEIYQRARKIAADILDGAQGPLDNPHGDMEKDYGDFLKSVVIRIDPSYMSDLPEGFRRQYRGKIKLTFDEGKGSSVDAVYMELQETFGEGYFPDEAINPADQLAVIADVYDRVKTEYGNPFEGHLNETLLGMTNDIIFSLLGEDVRQSAPTYADKAEARLENQKAHDRAAHDQLRAEKNARIAQIKSEASARKQEAVAKERAAKWAKVKALKAYYKDMQKRATARRHESAAATKHRASVIEKVTTLQNWLIRNTEKEHVPEALKAPLVDFLNTLDMRSGQQIKGKGLTRFDQQYIEKLRKIEDIYRKQASYMEKPGETEGLDAWLDMPSGFADSIKEHIDSVNAIFNGETLADIDDPIAEMNAAQLEDLDHILAVLTKSIKEMNRYITESRYRSVKEGAKNSTEYMNSLGADKSRRKATDAMGKFLNWSNAVPYYVFKRFGDAGADRFRAVIQGWGKMGFNAKRTIDFTAETYTAAEARRWEKELHVITLSNGKKATMTEAQMMSLWCLARREQGLGHLLAGGMRVGDIEDAGREKKNISQTDAYQLTQDDIAAIARPLSRRQLEVAGKMQEYLNTVCAEWGNEISMARFGFRQFTEENYFPITTDRNNHPANDPKARETDIFRLLNMSFSKALTPNANNSVVINSIFDVFSAHTADMAKYNGLALPVLDMLKWYNYKEKAYMDATDSQGNTSTQIKVDSVQAAVERAYGKKAQQYFLNFIKDLNGMREGGRNEDFLKGMVGKYKATAVALNLRVAIQQPASIVRAAYVIDPSYLSRGAAMKGGVKEALAHSGLAVWKDLGYFDTNIARNMREQIKHTDTVPDKIREKSMFLAEHGDKMTWGIIWNACKLEVSAKRRLSGEALMKATAERFDEVILATQVLDSTISRSDMMRGQNLAISEVTSFMSEPTMTFNMLADSINDYLRLRRELGNMVEARKRSWPQMGRALTAFAASSIVTAAFAAIVDAMRDDDDYQDAVEKWLEHYMANLKDNINPFRLLPIVSDIWSLVFEGEDPQSMIWQPLVQLRNASVSLKEILTLAFDPTAEVQNANRTQWGRLYYILQGISAISGLPLSSAMRDAKAVWNSSGWLINGNKIKFYDRGTANSVKYGLLDGYLTEAEAQQILIDSGEFADPDDAYWKVQEWLHSGDSSEWTRYDGVYSAVLAGDKKAFAAAGEELGDHGIPASSVRAQVKNEVGRWYIGETVGKDAAMEYLQSYAGLSKHEAQYLVDEWTCQVVTGIRLSDVDDEFISGNITEDRAAELLINYGHDYSKNAAEKIQEWKCERDTGYEFDRLNDAFIHNEITEQEALKLLTRYGGYSQTRAEEKVTEWTLAKDYGIKMGSTDHGIKRALIDEYITQEQAIDIMMAYDGKTRETAEDYSYQYLFTKETGYNFSEIQQALADEAIDEEQAAYWYRVGSLYTHGSEEKAWEYVEVARWKNEVPGAESMNRDGLDRWEQKSGKLNAQGLGMEDFAKAWAAYSEAEAEYDAEGEQTKTSAQVGIEAIGRLQGYTRNQLTALAYSVYSARKVNSYKTW